MPELHDLLERRASGYGPPVDILERVHDRRRRRDRNRRIGTAVIALVVAGVAIGGLLRMISSGSVPAADPRDPFLGTWVSTSDADGGTQTMTVQVFGGDDVEIVVTDDVATVCSGMPSTMTGTGWIEGGTQLVIPAPVYTCDNGSEPQVLSGPPLQEQLRDWTLVLDPENDTLSDGVGGVWVREGAEVPSPDPAMSDEMWPQSSLDEVRDAQELADAGDPRYTWQVDPELVGDAEPWGAEIVERFLREELGWEGFTPFGGYAYAEGGGLYDELVFLRCAPGRTNPLSNAYPDMPREVRGCAPTIDDFRYETVRLTMEQPARRGPSGIWVVTAWEILQPGGPQSTYDYLYPEFLGRQAEQAAPPTDSDVTAFLQAFLGARVDGEGAERYLRLKAEVPPSADEEVPLLYATTGGSPYERSEIERVQGPVWPTGWSEFTVRLFAEDGTVVEQSFVVVPYEVGRLGLVYGPQSGNRRIPTTENGRAVAVPYRFLDGEVTFAAAPPWGDTILDRTFTVLGGVGRGSAVQFTMFAIVADPLTASGCEAGPAPANAEALVRNIRSNPDLEATAPVAVSVGGIDALRMDVVAPGQLEAGDCVPMVLERLSLGPDGRMRVYLLDLPEGMSARILAVAISALDSEFEHVVEAAAPIVDSFEFHTR
jgi:hypothetical protein